VPRQPFGVVQTLLNALSHCVPQACLLLVCGPPKGGEPLTGGDQANNRDADIAAHHPTKSKPEGKQMLTNDRSILLVYSNGQWTVECDGDLLDLGRLLANAANQFKTEKATTATETNQPKKVAQPSPWPLPHGPSVFLGASGPVGPTKKGGNQ
jgi:hypothetical protein